MQRKLQEQAAHRMYVEAQLRQHHQQQEQFRQLQAQARPSAAAAAAQIHSPAAAAGRPEPPRYPVVRPQPLSPAQLAQLQHFPPSALPVPGVAAAPGPGPAALPMSGQAVHVGHNPDFLQQQLQQKAALTQQQRSLARPAAAAPGLGPEVHVGHNPDFVEQHLQRKAALAQQQGSLALPAAAVGAMQPVQTQAVQPGSQSAPAAYPHAGDQ